MTPRKILVAVESADCDAALQLAAAEARSRRCGVHLIHVNQPAYGGAGTPDHTAVVSGQLQRIGATVLGDASAKLDHLLIDDDELTVSTELCHGAVVPTLVAESIHASLVIMQHRGMGPAGDTSVMSVVHGVAARAHAPVVAVPGTWELDREAVPVVTVGVEDVAISAQVVRVALDEADRNDARLRMVHVYTPPQTGDPDLDRVAAVADARKIERELTAAYADLLAGRPEVPTELVVVPGRPVEALLEQARDTMLLVVGRRHPRLPIVSHLGPVARALLRWSQVPVLVVDPVTPEVGVPSGHGLATTAIP
jgi:nucleotide-binding universal stress UspA family protein